MGQDCKYCGAYIAGDADRCPACGKKIKTFGSSSGSAASAQAQEQSERVNESANGAYTYKEEYERRYGNYNEQSENRRQASRTQPYERREYKTRQNVSSAPSRGNGTRQNNEDDVKANRGISFLCYLGILFLIPYLLKRDSEFVKFHSNQGLLLFLAEIIVSICGELFFIGWIVSLAGGIFIIVSFIKGMTNVSKGVMEPLPLIGEISILK